MASTTFPLAQNGSFSFASPGSAFSGVVIHECRHSESHEVEDTTGTRIVGGAAVQDKSKQYVQRLPMGDLFARGVVEKAGVYAHAQQSNVTFSGNGFEVKVSEFKLRKFWPLVDVTHSTSKEWTWGIPIYTLTGRGWAHDAGPGYDTAEDTVSLAIDQMGTVSWATVGNKVAVIQETAVVAPLGIGGGIPFAFSAVFRGDVTYAAGANSFAWLFINPASLDDAPLREVVTLDTDAQPVTGPVLLYDHTFNCPKVNGGPIDYQLRMRFDGA